MMDSIVTCPNCQAEIKLTESPAAPLFESTRQPPAINEERTNFRQDGDQHAHLNLKNEDKTIIDLQVKVNDSTQSPRALDDVISRLDEIIGWSIRERHRYGYFAALYKLVTFAVLDGLKNGRFQDPQLLNKLTIRFANRYLDALDGFCAGAPVSKSWAVAFDACQSPEPVCLQHLLAGINAHINFDLAIAAADTAPGEDIVKLKDDFDAINDVLREQTERVTHILLMVSPRLNIMTSIAVAGRRSLIEIALRATRGEAWHLAERLAKTSPADREAVLVELDIDVAKLGREILHPGFPLSKVMPFIRRAETDDIRLAIRTVRDGLRNQEDEEFKKLKTDVERQIPSLSDYPKSVVELVLRVAWPLFLHRRRLFYALFVAAAIVAASIWLWRSSTPSAQQRVVDWLAVYTQDGAATDYPNVEIQTHENELDLRDWKLVPSGQDGQKISRAVFRKRFYLRKVRKGEAFFSTRWGTTSPIDPEFAVYPLSLSKHIVAASDLSARGLKYRRWDLVADLSPLREDDEVGLVFESEMWNAFQSPTGDNATAACFYPMATMNFTIRFPKPVENLKFFDVKESSSVQPAPIKDPDVTYSDVGRTLVWTIKNPSLRHGYRVEWDWPHVTPAYAPTTSP